MDNELVLKQETQCRALKLRIYPSQEQEILINKTFGCARKVYNQRIAEKQEFYNNIIKPEENKEKRKELWKTAKFLSVKELKLQFPYLSEPSAQSLSFAVMSAEQAYTNFLQSLTGKRKGRKMGYKKTPPSVAAANVKVAGTSYNGVVCAMPLTRFLNYCIIIYWSKNGNRQSISGKLSE